MPPALPGGSGFRSIGSLGGRSAGSSPRADRISSRRSLRPPRPRSPRPAGDLPLPSLLSSRDLVSPFLSPPPTLGLATPPPRPLGDRESSSSRLSRRERLRRRSLSEEDELDELDELERPISLAPITAFPLQTIPQHENLQISWARKKASKNASRLARTRLKHHKITVFDFPPFSPCFLKLFSQLLLAQPHLSAGIG